MRVFHIGNNVTSFSEIFPAPSPQLDAGDKIIVLQSFSTLGNEQYEGGDILEVVGRTNEMPYQRITTEGNLRIRGKNGEITIWSNIEWLISQGVMRRIWTQGRFD
jgi:hypothetical protein